MLSELFEAAKDEPKQRHTNNPSQHRDSEGQTTSRRKHVPHGFTWFALLEIVLVDLFLKCRS